MLIFYSCKKEYSYEGGKNNKSPLAVAGPIRTSLYQPDSVLLNGGKSSDSDGKISAWQWTKLTGPASFTMSNSVDEKA